MTKELGSIETELISSPEDEGLFPTDEIVVVSDSNVDLSFLHRLSSVYGRVGRLALPVTLAIALTNAACDQDNFLDPNTSYANSTPIVESSPAFASPPIEYTATSTHENSAMTPSISPTEESTNTPEPTYTPTLEPTATPTEVPTSTPTPEPEPTKEITYSGKMEFKLDTELTSEDISLRELILNPLFNKDGMNAEEAIQRAILKAHYRAYVSAHEGRKTPEELKALSPEEFEKKLLAGEDMSYLIYGKKREDSAENQKAEPLKVDPAKGLNFAVSTDPSLNQAASDKFQGGNIKTGSYGIEYSYIVGPDGTLTCMLHTISNYNNDEGTFTLGMLLLDGAQIMAEATQNAGGEFKFTHENYDYDITLWATAPADSEPDGNKIIQIRSGEKYTPIFIKPQ